MSENQRVIIIFSLNNELLQMSFGSEVLLSAGSHPVINTPPQISGPPLFLRQFLND